MRAALVVRRAMALAALAFAVLLGGCGPTSGRLVLSDELATLAREEVEVAAAPLRARGATVAILVIARGDDTGADLTERLGAAGLLEGGQVAPDTLALYISYEPRYSELRAGSRWSRLLPASALREIRTTTLNPALRREAPTGGVVATLEALEARLGRPPLIEQVSQALGVVVAAAVAVAVLALSPLGERLGRWWRRSPPGRFTRWLGDQTPGGRRRLERIIRTTRQRMEDRAAYARSWCKAVAGQQRAEAAALQTRLKALEREREALTGGARRGRALEEAMDRLAWEYETLGHAAARMVPPSTPAKGKRKHSSSDISTSAAGVAATTPGADSSSSTSDSSPTWDATGSGDSGASSDGGAW
jgi:hypothetical protein